MARGKVQLAMKLDEKIKIDGNAVLVLFCASVIAGVGFGIGQNIVQDPIEVVVTLTSDVEVFDESQYQEASRPSSL